MNSKMMVCIDNKDYEDSLTIGKTYLVEIEDIGNGSTIKKFHDDQGEFLQTMLERFE